jgi:hypothetical protein
VELQAFGVISLVVPPRLFLMVLPVTPHGLFDWHFEVPAPVIKSICCTLRRYFVPPSFAEAMEGRRERVLFKRAHKVGLKNGK